MNIDTHLPSEPRSKRARSLSASSASSSSTSSSVSDASAGSGSRHPAKFHRAVPSAPGTYTCCLPPTCHQPSTSPSFGTAGELERHQEQYHRFVCRVPIRDKGSGGRAVSTTYATGSAPASGSASAGAGAAEMDGSYREGSELPAGFVSGGGQRGRWKECGKVFPDDRFLSLVRLLLSL